MQTPYCASCLAKARLPQTQRFGKSDTGVFSALMAR
jgi:hypothetical protein